jgi:lysophospholipase L1-like esterase
LLVAAALVAVLLTGLHALGIGRHRPPIVVIGDSITANLQPTLRQTLGDDYTLTIDGKPGFLVSDQLGAVQNAARFPFRQAVVNLGTNDAMSSDHDLDESIASLEQIVATLADVDCLHLVTINETMVNDTNDARARARRLNDAIRDLEARDPHIRVIDWERVVRDYENEHPDETVTTDTVHPNDVGNRLLADAYRESLAACAT